MKDKIISETETISQSYNSRKGQTYEELGSKAEDWKACKIIGYFFMPGVGEVPEYEIPKGYARAITRYTDKHGDDRHCNLCGHYIEFYHYIQNDKLSLFMLVGSECVHQNYGRVVRKKIKEFKDNRTRQEAKQFLMEFIEWANTQKQYKNPVNNYEKNQLIYFVYLERNKAQDILDDFDGTGIRKLQNFMKKHKEDLKIPPVKQEFNDYAIKTGDDLIDAYNKDESDRIIAFGKYTGKRLKEVPGDYIVWMAGKLEADRK